MDASLRMWILRVRSAFLMVVCVSGLLVIAACHRREALDIAVANQLLNVIARGYQPTIHGNDLARVSKELFRYQKLLGDFVAGGNEFFIRDALGAAYLRWGYDEEAFIVLVEGISGKELGPLGRKLVVLESAIRGDASRLEQVLNVFGTGFDSMLSAETLRAIAHNDIQNGVKYALQEVEKMSDVGDRFFFTIFVARVVAKNVSNIALAGLDDNIYYLRLREFNRGGTWDEFLERFSSGRHDFLEAVLWKDLVSIMSLAAEYYARRGDADKAIEWLKKLSNLEEVLRRGDNINAAWVAFLTEQNTSRLEGVLPK